MEKKNETISELTPDQMEKISGGAGTAIECQCSPDGKHLWNTGKKTRECIYCYKTEIIRSDSYDIF